MCKDRARGTMDHRGQRPSSLSDKRTIRCSQVSNISLYHFNKDPGGPPPSLAELRTHFKAALIYFYSDPPIKTRSTGFPFSVQYQVSR